MDNDPFGISAEEAEKRAAHAALVGVLDASLELTGSPCWNSLANRLCYQSPKFASAKARMALEFAWQNMVHESARIVEADQAGTLNKYLATKERTP